MHREFFKIGQFALHGWGVMVAIGFAIGLIVAVRRAKKVGFPETHIFDLAVAVIVAAIVFSRLWYVVTTFDEFRGNLLDIINPFQTGGFGISGMSMVGGVIAAIITGMLYCLIRKVNFWEITDIIAPTFLLGMFFGRFGCLLNGCCFGHECNLPWGLVFPSSCAAGSVFHNTPIHPTQIYEGTLDLIFFFYLIAWEKRGKKFVGHAFWLSFFFYGLGRVIADYWRFYEERDIVLHYLGGNLSIHGAITLALMVLCLMMIFLKVGKPLPVKKAKK